MPRDLSRRGALTIGLSGLATALGGCQGLTSSKDTPTLDLIVLNTTAEAQEGDVEIIDPDQNGNEVLVYELSKDSRDSAGAYIEIPADSERTFEAVAEKNRYTVRAAVNQEPADNWRHYHYTPAPGVDYESQVFVQIYRLEGTNEAFIRFGPGP